MYFRPWTTVYVWVVAGPNEVFIMEDWTCNRKLLLRSQILGDKDSPIFTACAVSGCWSSLSSLLGKTDLFIFRFTSWIEELELKKKSRLEHLLLSIWPFRWIEYNVRGFFSHQRILWKTLVQTRGQLSVANTPDVNWTHSEAAAPYTDALGSATAPCWHRFTQATSSFKSHFCLRDVTVNSCSQPKPFLLSGLELGGRGDLETVALLSSIYNWHFLQKLYNVLIHSCPDTLVFVQAILHLALV